MGYEMFIFWFWESPTTGWHACKVNKHFHCLLICIYFYLICSTTHWLTLIVVIGPIGRFHFHFIIKVAFVRAVLLCLLQLLGEQLLQRRHLMAKNEFAFSFRPTRTDQQVGRQYATVSCWLQHETAWDLLEKRPISMIQSRLFLLRDNDFIYGALSDLKFCRMFPFT